MSSNAFGSKTGEAFRTRIVPHFHGPVVNVRIPEALFSALDPIRLDPSDACGLASPHPFRQKSDDYHPLFCSRDCIFRRCGSCSSARCSVDPFLTKESRRFGRDAVSPGQNAIPFAQAETITITITIAQRDCQAER